MKKTSKKALQKFKKTDLLPYEASQIADFLEDFQTMIGGQDKKTKLISIRVPENILEAFKFKAKTKNQKYQSLIVELMRVWIRDNSK